MRSRHGPEPLATQATAHSLHTQASVATRPLASQRQSAVGLHLRNPSLMDYYSFNRPRRDGRLSRPCWLTNSGRFTHKEVTRPAVSLAQDRESTRTGPAVLTTMPRHHLSVEVAAASPACEAVTSTDHLQAYLTRGRSHFTFTAAPYILSLIAIVDLSFRMQMYSNSISFFASSYRRRYNAVNC